jgi:apolipoprotein D and lipocalin family protein
VSRLPGLAALAAFVALSVVCAAPPVESVPAVDPQRYAGTWYELARLPNRFQSHCLGDVRATYTPLPDGGLEVTNRCRARGGESVTEGRATAAPGDDSGARWKVSFLPSWLQWLPLGRGDYWVVMLDPGYRHAVVSEPGREFLWILSRTPAMDDAAYGQLLERLADAGYPVDKLVRTPHRSASPVARVSRML